MKKLQILLATILSLTLFSCSGCGDNEPKDKAPVEDTTLFKGNIKAVSIELAKVPKEVVDGIKAQYPDAKIMTAKVLDNELDKTYSLELDNNGEQLKVEITESGQILIK
ncbi:MAG: hypothetical protein WCR42_09440 [bacterium]